MLDADRLLFDDSEETELERCRGSWRPAVSALARDADERLHLETAVSLFERHVLPIHRAAKTRKQYCRDWWAVGAVSRCSGSGTRSHFSARSRWLEFMKTIQARHLHFRHGSPIGPDGDYSRYLYFFSRFQGRQRGQLYTIHRDIKVRLPRFPCPPHGPCAGFKGRCAICVEFMHNWRACLGTSLLNIGSWMRQGTGWKMGQKQIRATGGQTTTRTLATKNIRERVP